MSRTVLVIDSNPAVQAIASLALSHLGVQVQTIASAAAAMSAIETHAPDLIVCSSEVSGLDAFELCQTIRNNPKLAHAGFILLTPNSEAEVLGKKAISTGIDEILPKPFKSEQLRNIVETVLQRNAERGEQSAHALLLIKNSILSKALQHDLAHRNTSTHICESEQGLISAANNGTFSVTIVEAAAVADFSWHDARKMGSLIIIAGDDPASANLKATKDRKILKRPLQQKDLNATLEGLLPEHQQIEKDSNSTLSHDQQAVLAARVSATVFERLLLHQALKNRQWDEVTHSISEEMSRVFEEFEQLSHD